MAPDFAGRDALRTLFAQIRVVRHLANQDLRDTDFRTAAAQTLWGLRKAVRKELKVLGWGEMTPNEVRIALEMIDGDAGFGKHL